MKKFAFTLAEVLITLTVIGVVAAMVLPNLMKHYEKKTLETQTKHFYSMMTLAVHNYMADNKIDDLTDSPLFCERFESGEECEKDVRDFIMKYLKVALVCRNINSVDNSCYETTAKVIDKRSENHGSWGPDYILAHGYAMHVREMPNPQSPFNIIVDVNGEAGPNRGGRDIWNINVYYDGTINGAHLNPECVKDSSCTQRTINRLFYSKCFTSYDGDGCFGHFRENGFKFDY